MTASRHRFCNYPGRMSGLRSKLFLAFAGLFLLLSLVASLSVVMIDKVSTSFDRIFHENLETIQACREMRGSLEKTNEALLIALWGNGDLDSAQVREAEREFGANLRFQSGNITIDGEGELTRDLATAWDAYRYQYSTLMGNLALGGDRGGDRLDAHFRRLRAVDSLIGRIADLNARNILSADGQVRSQAGSARRSIIALLVAGGVLLVVLLAFTGRLILNPIRALMLSAQEIEKGNLDLSLEVKSRDELGRLAEAFNAMAARLREFRRTDRAKLLMTQKTTQMAINSLPDAVAVLGADGMVEMSNAPAQGLFGITPGSWIGKTGLEWLLELFEKVKREVKPSTPESYDSAIQVFRDGEERFFLPHLIPIIEEKRQLYGITLVLADVTELRRLDESKSDLLATVSHEFKTRLTSVRMGVHLLLDGKIGTLNSPQIELLLAAREDAEHLHRMIEGLLDIGRIRSGQMKMRFQALPGEEPILRAWEGMRHAFQDKGLQLERESAGNLPPVQADPTRVHLVLDNLLSNALKYTPAGGKAWISAKAEDRFVVYTVRDTGAGIPESDLPKVFERFYRGSREGEGSGAGLGLAIAKEVVEAHGGTMTVASEEGKGSAFTFSLRRADQEQAA